MRQCWALVSWHALGDLPRAEPWRHTFLQTVLCTCVERVPQLLLPLLPLLLLLLLLLPCNAPHGGRNQCQKMRHVFVGAWARIHCDTILSNTFQNDSIRFDTIQFNTIQYYSIRINTIQYDSMRFNTIQYDSVRFSTIQYWKSLEIIGNHWKSLKITENHE